MFSVQFLIKKNEGKYLKRFFFSKKNSIFELILQINIELEK